jgi:hypothetical protein
MLRTTKLQSRRHERNIENAVRRCGKPRHIRPGILENWSRIFDISTETFILLVATFSYNRLTRRTSSLPWLLGKLVPTYSIDLICLFLWDDWLLFNYDVCAGSSRDTVLHITLEFVRIPGTD